MAPEGLQFDMIEQSHKQKLNKYNDIVLGVLGTYSYPKGLGLGYIIFLTSSALFLLQATEHT